MLCLQISHPKNYSKIPKISPGPNMFQRPFLKGFFWGEEGGGGGYNWRGLSTEGNLRFKIGIIASKFSVFALFYFVFEGNFLSTSPRGLIFGGAI